MAATDARETAMTARNRPRGVRVDAFGDLSSDCVVMRGAKPFPC
jgi:hypothetical protein